MPTVAQASTKTSILRNGTSAPAPHPADATLLNRALQKSERFEKELQHQRNVVSTTQAELAQARQELEQMEMIKIALS